MTRPVRVLLAGALLALGAGVHAGPAAAPAKGTEARLTTLRGVVKSLTATRLVLEVPGSPKATETALVVGEATVVMKGRTVLALKDLHPGDPVTVAYAEADGRAVAKRIWVRSPGAGALSPAPAPSATKKP